MIYKPDKLNNHFRNFFICFLFVLIILLALVEFVFFSPGLSRDNDLNTPIRFDNLNNIPINTVNDKITLKKSGQRNGKCSYYDCFNVYKCGHLGENHIKVYIYPFRNYIDSNGKLLTPTLSLEYYNILKAIAESRYYTSNPKEACLFIPSIDTLNQNRLDVDAVSRAITSLQYWNNGGNHLVWNFVPGNAPDYNTVIDLHLGDAIVAGAGFSSWTYRPGFDVSIPVYSPLVHNISFGTLHKRRWFAVSAQAHLHRDYERELSTMSEIIRFTGCHNERNIRCYNGKQFKYPDILKEATFCIIIRTARLGQQALLESMAAGCIPVIVADSLVLPFEDVIDWKRAAVKVSEREHLNLMDKLLNISHQKRQELHKQVMWLYEKYFSSVEKIALTALNIINYRVHPQHAPHYEHWNLPEQLISSRNPLLLEMTAPRTPGFTAVILTYDRVDSLFLLIQQLTRVPSLSKILVVWNNQHKSPPPLSQWPVVNGGATSSGSSGNGKGDGGVRLEVVRTRENKLSNRFYPYEGIETEAVLSIDDDIVMLTADEVEFAFEVWREFPDRIVGFPSRTHVWDNVTYAWKYESEWRNDISMVLTGAAFHHKYWNYLYTTAMPGEIKEWVDDHMNCEDIAMNFLVANITGKAPIKVAPRKKFKCPECTNTEMLSADLQHMVQRTDCINKFTEIYGRMPLINVEFRADPVLYKDNFPEKLKRFNDIGSL